MNGNKSFSNMISRAYVFDPLIFRLPLLAVHHLFWWLPVYLFIYLFFYLLLTFFSLSLFLLFSWLTTQNSPLKTLFLLILHKILKILTYGQPPAATLWWSEPPQPPL